MRNNGYTYHDHIPSREAGSTLLSYYVRRYTHSSTEEWRSQIAAGRVARNGCVERDASCVLAAGDRLAWLRPPWEEEEVPTDIVVLAEGQGWMVLHKPSGLPVLPGGGFLENTLLHIVRRRYGDVTAPLHRLGRGTSGAILFTHATEAARVLSQAMREGRITKTYLALAQGIPDEDAFTVDMPIGPVPYGPLGVLHAASPTGRPSLSHCRVLHRDIDRETSLLEIDIPTGRPHQIRIHCAVAGFPLVGDPLYRAGGVPINGNALPGDLGYHLHSWHIRFPDPTGSESVSVTAPPPALLVPPI